MALDRALDEAERQISAKPHSGMSAPRPYPSLARAGRSWIKVGRYGIAYSLTPTVSITAVFYDQSDIPGRLPPLR